MLLWAPLSVEAAGGVFAVDDSDIAKPGECRVESWAAFARNSDLAVVVSPACVVSLGVPVEVGISVQRSRADDAWATSSALKAKVNLRPAEIGRLGIALSGAVGFDQVAGDYTSALFNVPFTFQVDDKLRINVNAGALFERAADANYVTWGAGFERKLTTSLTLIGEIYGQAGKLLPDAPSDLFAPRLQLGWRWTLAERIDLDLIYGRNATGEGSDWVTAGVNVRLP